MAQKLSPHQIKLFGSPWSPPAWMKTNHKFQAGGQLRGEVGGEYYQIFADYFVKYEIIQVYEFSQFFEFSNQKIQIFQFFVLDF
jgi:O-glycosyl hydrolase